MLQCSLQLRLRPGLQLAHRQMQPETSMGGPAELEPASFLVVPAVLRCVEAVGWLWGCLPPAVLQQQV